MMEQNQLPQLFIDTFEPIEIEALMKPAANVIRASLNSLGFADYMWDSFNDGHRVQIERKQIDEILQDLDAVEEQLEREYPKAEENYLLIEGFCEPLSELKNEIQIFKKSRDGKVMVAGRKYGYSYSRWQAWQHKMDKCGVTVVTTSDYIATAITVVALYKATQDPRVVNFRRYIKEKVHLEEYNPQVAALIALGSAFKVEIGEKKAKALIERYYTVWAVLNQDVDSLADTQYVGKGTARKLLESIGRVDV